MKLVIDRSELLRTLGHVTSVVERRTTIPILSNVLMRADASRLELKATDLEREIIEVAPAETPTPGVTTVSAHVLHDIVRKLPDGSQVELETDGADGRMTLTSGKSRFSLPILSAEDFPDIGAGEMTHEFEVAAKDLKRLIEKTRFAISQEETRYYLNGIYLHPAETDGKPMLRGVATDGHRLAQFELERPDGLDDMPGVIVPRKTVNDLHRLIEDSDEAIKVALSTSKIRFNTGTVVLTSKLIDGSFPDYGRVIPQGNDKVMDVPISAFSSAVDRVSAISSERARPVKLAIEKERLTLSVNSPDSGSATEELGVDYDADPMEIGFNGRYLLDISGQLESETVHFYLADPGSPTMVRDGKDMSALYVLMPMRV